MESLPYPASPARIQALAVVSPAGYWLRYPPRDSPIPPAMAAVVAQGQLTATPITNPFGLAGAAGVAADILGRLAPSLHLGRLAAATGLLWDRTGRPAIQPTPLPRRPHGRAVVIRPREQTDPDGIAAELLAVVEQSVQPVRLSL
jgi:hypothetical protein